MTGKPGNGQGGQRLDKPPRKPAPKDRSGKLTDNPKLPKQAGGNEPTGMSGAKARDALKH
jgi:hypothetical protein